MKVFSDDVDTIANRVEMKFFHFMCSCLEFPKIKDTKIVDAKYVFMGPCTPFDITKKRCKFKENDVASVKYKPIKMRNRILSRTRHE